MTEQQAPIDISRSRIERLQAIGCVDYLHMALLDALEAAEKKRDEALELVKDYEYSAADKRRLAREMAVMIDGEEAAEQPALCDVAAMVRDLVAERDQALASVGAVIEARDMMGRLWATAVEEREQQRSDKFNATAASAAREIAMRERAAGCEEEVGIAFGVCRDETGDEYNQGWIDCTEHWLEEIRALPLSPDGQQALNDVRAEEWQKGWYVGFSDARTSIVTPNPHRKDSNEGDT